MSSSGLPPKRNRTAASHVRTFEDRGIKICFQHKYLQSLRLRVPRGPDPRDWEVTMQNYFGTGANNFAVINWTHLPNFVSLDRHDVELYQAVLAAGKQRPIDPFTIRSIHLQIDSEHAAGADQRAAAKRELDGEEQERFNVHLSFLAHLVRECTIKMGDAGMVNASNETIRRALMNADGTVARLDQNDLMVKVARYMAKTYKIDNDALTDRVEKLARLLAPFGSINASGADRTDGFLSREFARLKEFHRQLGTLEASGKQYLRDTAAVIMFATKEYIDLISNRLESAEQKLSNFASLLSQYNDSLTFFKKHRRDVVFALDGWSMLIDIWDRAYGTPEGATRDDALRRALTDILQWLPILPVEEVRDDGERRAIWKQYDMIRTNVVKLMHNWLDDEPDLELMDRVNTSRDREELRKPGRAWTEADRSEDGA